MKAKLKNQLKKLFNELAIHGERFVTMDKSIRETFPDSFKINPKESRLDFLIITSQLIIEAFPRFIMIHQIEIYPDLETGSIKFISEITS